MSNVLSQKVTFDGWFKDPVTDLWVNKTRSIRFTDEEMMVALHFDECGQRNEAQRSVLMRLASKCLVEHLGGGVFEGTPALQHLQRAFQESCRAPGPHQ